MSKRDPKYLLRGTGAQRRNQAKITAFEGANRTYTWSAQVGIPKNIFLTLLSLVDTQRSHQGVLTREELDVNHDTKRLPSWYKDALIKHAPTYLDWLNAAKNFQESQADAVQMGVEAYENGRRVFKKAGITRNTPPVEKYARLAKVAADRFAETQATALDFSEEELQNDPIKLALHDAALERSFKYAKGWKIHKDISEFHRQYEGKTTIEATIQKNEELVAKYAASEAFLENNVDDLEGDAFDAEVNDE